MELSTHAPQIRPSFMLFGGAGAVAVAVAVAARQAGASSAKASSSPPPNTTTPPDHHPHTHLHLSSSTHLSLPHHSHSPPSPPPPSIIHTPSPLAPGRTTHQHRPTTRRCKRSLHIIHHGQVIENACCCPRHGWRRRCSSAGKSCFLIWCRNAMVLACPCMRTCNPPAGYRKSYPSVPYTWSLARHFLSRDELADELRLPQACFAPAVQQEACHRNRGNARLCYLHQHSRCIEQDNTYATHNNLKYAEKKKEVRPISGRRGQLQRRDKILRRRHGLLSIFAFNSRTSRDPRACGSPSQT